MSSRPSVVLFNSAHVSGVGQALVPGAALQVGVSLGMILPHTRVTARDRKHSEATDNIIDPDPLVPRRVAC